MATSSADIKTRLSELSADAFQAFCDDISGMFGIEMQSELSGDSRESARTLKKTFKKVSAVITVKSTGILEGDLYIVFDKDALFTLSGTIVMLPEARIVEHCKKGTLKDAEELHDAVGETGNLLVGSWDRIFRENLEGHTHLLQTGTYIGNPWDDAQSCLGVSNDQSFLFFPCEMTVGDFPSFQCGVIFPDTILEKSSEEPVESALGEPEAASEDVASPEEGEPVSPDVQVQAEQPVAPESQEAQVSAEQPTDPEPQEPSSPTEQPTAAEPPAEEKSADKDSREAQEADEKHQRQATPSQPVEIPSLKDSPDVQREVAAGTVSQTIEQMVQSMSSSSLDSAAAILNRSASDVMTRQILWGNPDDSVQDAIEKMQQADTDCLMIGSAGSLEGIVTWIDVAEAVSIYLRPVFARWRRPADDATLQIKLKILMTRPVRTIRPQTPLASVMEDMCRHRLRCLPVVDEQGAVQGVVTSSGIFRFFLKMSADFSITDKQAQCAATPV